MKRRYIIAIGVVVFVIALYVFSSIPFRTDRGFVCENTGSTQGYTEWIVGIKTGHWYEKSALEDFILANYQDNLQHRWTSYLGDRKNLLGTVVARGHGMPGPIFEMITFLEDWVHENEPEEILALYELLSSDMDEDVMRQKVGEIIEDYLDFHEQQDIDAPIPTGLDNNNSQ
ncbi:MAG: hypothetical protein ACYTET_07820 [Planctomycetota bacterium]|jgi:hypothetical protein